MKTLFTFLFSAVALNCFAILPPVVTSASATFTVGVPGSITLAATNPPLNSGSWQETSGNLPASVLLDPFTGKLTGTPLPEDVGDHVLSLSVSNAAGYSAPKAFTLTVRPAPCIVILKEASPYTDTYYIYDHDSTNVVSDPGDNVLQIDEIAADFPYAPFTSTGIETGYYILDMIAQQYTHVVYYTTTSGGSTQKNYYVDVAGAPFVSDNGILDAFIPSRTAGTRDVVFGKAHPDNGFDPSGIFEDFASYRGSASALALTTGTPTVPAWTIPFAVKSLSGKKFYFANQAFANSDPMVVTFQYYFGNTAITVSLDAVLTPQANAGGLLPVINPATGLPLVPPQNWDGLVSDTLEYGVQLVKNTLEKLKYAEAP